MPDNYTNDAPAAPAEQGASETIVALPISLTQGASEKPCEITAQAPDDPSADAVAKLKLVPPSNSDSANGAFKKSIGAVKDQSALACALAYAEHGLPVLLAKPNTKDAYFRDKTDSALLDKVAIQAAFAEHPNANVAVVPGTKPGVPEFQLRA